MINFKKEYCQSRETNEKQLGKTEKREGGDHHPALGLPREIQRGYPTPPQTQTSFSDDINARINEDHTRITNNHKRTTSENTKHNANMLESNASFNPIAVVNPTTNAVCELGIPPLPTSRPQSTFPCVWQCVNTLQICAIVKESMAATNAGDPTREDAPFAKLPILLLSVVRIFQSLSVVPSPFLCIKRFRALLCLSRFAKFYV